MKKTSLGYRITSICSKVFIYVLSACILIAALLFAADMNPQKTLFGYRYYTVLTPSMMPALAVGDLVIVKQADADEIQVGDVITFNPSSDSDAYLTHRVTEKYEDYEGTGVTCYTTKGDANDSEDGFLIDQSRVIGVVVISIPKLGYMIRFVQLRWYYVLPIIVMLYIFFKLLGIYFRHDEETEEKPEEDTGDHV